MPTLQHKKACATCPFRRDSLAGYLGEEKDPSNFTKNALADYVDHQYPCHESINYNDAFWRHNLDQAAICAGALVFARNQSKMPRDPDRAALVRAVDPDPEVFMWESEFLEHHSPQEEAE